MLALLLALATAAPPPGVSAEEAQAAKAAVLRAMVRGRKGEPAARAGELAAGATPLDRFASSYAMADEEEAWARMRRLAMEEPELPWGELGMARIYVTWRLPDQAGPAFERALRIAPALPLAVLERAIGERRFKQADDALRDVQAVLAQDPRDPRALLLLAQLEEDSGKDATRRYQAALQAAPDLFEAAAALARVADQRGDAKASLAYWERCGELAPRDPEVLRRLAELREAAGDRSGATKALGALLSQSRGGKAELQRLAELQRKLGNPDEEEKLLRRLRRLDATDRAPLLRLSELHRSQPDPAALEEDLTRLVQLDPHDAGSHLKLAAVRAKAGDLLGEIQQLFLAEQGTEYPEATGARARAKAERQHLKVETLAPEEPLVVADVKHLQAQLARVLDRAFTERRKELPALHGQLKIKLRVSAAGEVESVELTDDGVGDPPLAACLLLTARDARVQDHAAGAFSLAFNLKAHEVRR